MASVQELHVILFILILEEELLLVLNPGRPTSLKGTISVMGDAVLGFFKAREPAMIGLIFYEGEKLGPALKVNINIIHGLEPDFSNGAGSSLNG